MRPTRTLCAVCFSSSRIGICIRNLKDNYNTFPCTSSLPKQLILLMQQPIHKINSIGSIRLMSNSNHGSNSKGDGGGMNSSRDFVKIGAVKLPIRAAQNPELVPAGFAGGGHQPQALVRTLKWMLQKQLLGQDIFLIGTPGFARSSVLLQFLEICNREFELLTITRDTTEADIKQRREIRAGSAFYTDLCAVKAALHGRVLVIDGVEKAERNVLPILNNLLENREMQLDDGRFLMAADKFDKLLQKYTAEQLRQWKLERVSEHFAVVALGLPVPSFPGHSLDPPLRSRFQCRHIGPPPFDTMRTLCAWLGPEVPEWKLTNLLSLVYGLNVREEAAEQNLGGQAQQQQQHSKDSSRELPQFPTDSLVKAVQNNCPSLSEEHILHFCYPPHMLKADSQRPLFESYKSKFGVSPAARLDSRWDRTEEEEKKQPQPQNGDLTGKLTAQLAPMAEAELSSEDGKCSIKVKVPKGNLALNCSTTGPGGFIASPGADQLLADLLLLHSGAADFCLLGARGLGKSTLVHEFARRLGYQLETVVLYQDMNSRELLQRRRMLENGDTVWEDGQLVKAAKQGHLCVLDGLDRVHWSTAECIATLVHHRLLVLPDGTRLIGAANFELLQRKTGLSEQQLNEKHVFRIAPNFRIVALGDSDSAPKWLNAQLNSMFLFCSLPELTLADRLKLIQNKVPKASERDAKKLLKLVERLSQSHDASIRAIASCLSLRRLVHILHRHSIHPEEGVYEAVNRAALARFLPPVVKRAFESTLRELGIVSDRKAGGGGETVAQWAKKLGTTASSRKRTVDGETAAAQEMGSPRLAADEAMIPSTLFFDNPQHLQVMADMARDFELGSHLLLIGNQGVGKNKVTDRLLQLLSRPRKYMQLHRDTTVQSLTVQSTVEAGILRFEDSPLVQAIQDGLVLVVDEADKAPLHVVAILKSLLDAESFYLSDGRRVCPAAAKDNDSEEERSNNNIYVHPDFRMIMLANRPGFPFLGNDLYALLGDLLAVHALDNPSRESELAMLSKYGPDVPVKTLELLVSVFGELRSLVDQSLLNYPYSTRELVNIVKHLQKFPDETVEQAVHNVFDFDAFSPDTVELIKETFERKGVKIVLGSGSAMADGTADAYGSWDRILGKRGRQQEEERIELERDGSSFDISKLLDPKFGQMDADNTPHIGGNTWAGGVGGYSTAGLGGVGGPFRLDAGHTVHQMPESAKQQVPEHILKKAREINRREYAKRLKEIEMSEYDADAYNQLGARIGKQVRVLRGIIDSLESREHERQWAKHQTSGDLDDGKLIEGMAGEKNIYRKRVDQPPDPSSQAKPKRIRLCFDVSGSMYRFNGYDNRLQRSLEAALLVMEALDGKSEKIKYDLFGHSGESPEIPFVTMDRLPSNEKDKMVVLKRMLAHSQFCSSGDYTIEALAAAVREMKAEADAFDERFVFLLSDANLDRYGIRPAEMRRALLLDESVNAFVILIGSLGEQAMNLQKALPAGKAFLAMDAAQIPEILHKIFSSTIVK